MAMRIILLIGLMCVALIGYAADDTQSTKEKTLVELKSNHLSSEINLGTHFLTRFHKHYAGYEINSYCVGSFKKAGEFEYLLGIVNPKNGEGEYVIFLGDTVEKIEKFSLAPTWQENLPEVKCFSEMGVKRLNATIKNSESIVGRINPQTHFDVACIAPYSSHNAFTCYAYGSKRSTFIGIGGWTN